MRARRCSRGCSATCSRRRSTRSSSARSALPPTARPTCSRSSAPGSPPTAGGTPDGLSDREIEILRLIALGHTNTEIAEQLFLSVRTVESHRAHIQQKLRLSKRSELVRYALERGLMDGGEVNTGSSAPGSRTRTIAPPRRELTPRAPPRSCDPLAEPLEAASRPGPRCIEPSRSSAIDSAMPARAAAAGGTSTRPRAGVAGVCQRLLNDPEDRALDLRRQPAGPRGRRARGRVDLEAGLGCCSASPRSASIRPSSSSAAGRSSAISERSARRDASSSIAQSCSSRRRLRRRRSPGGGSPLCDRGRQPPRRPLGLRNLSQGASSVRKRSADPWIQRDRPA